MSNDLEILKELEKEIGRSSAQMDYDQIIYAPMDENIIRYSLDDHNHVIAIRLSGFRLPRLPVAILKFKHLRGLQLWENRIKELPSEIAQLTDLEFLSMNFNRLTSLPVELGLLTKLCVLNVLENEIKVIPSEVVFLPELKNLEISKNPLEYPPVEISTRGIAAIREYFNAISGSKRQLNEVKILLVGDGGVGKTSLIKQLFEDKFDPFESQTHGINVSTHKIKNDGGDIIAHFWDFGGQQIMHATHQFFLSKRSMYILVLDGRREEDPEYWLKHIESFGGDSPIIVVLNKMDENPSFEVNRRFLMGKYKGIYSIHRVSCASGEGISNLYQELIKAISCVEILSTTWAEPWFFVKKELETISKDYISYDDFQKICNRFGICTRTTQDTLLAFLHDLGIILHFTEVRLLDTQVLNPAWVTNGVYYIINSPQVADNKGILEIDALGTILPRGENGDVCYPTNKYHYLLDLMLKFELCYEIDSQRVLIPDLLEVQEPKIDMDLSQALTFRVDYDFLPRSVLPRLMVRLHADIEGANRWRSGVVLVGDGARAIVRADYRERSIVIQVDGPNRREYLTIIRFVLMNINRSFEKLQYIERVTLPDNPNVGVMYSHLVRLERNGTDEYFPENGDRPYSIKELLGTVFIEKVTPKDVETLLERVANLGDTEESLLEKANAIVQLQPNIVGIGVNLNELIRIILGRLKKGREKIKTSNQLR